MKRHNPVIDIQKNVPGQANKFMVDGVDCSGAAYLVITFDAKRGASYLVGTISPQEIKEITNTEVNGK